MARGFKADRRDFLNKEQCRLLHENSCRLLAETGIELEQGRAVDIFTGAGASYEQGRVKIPARLVEDTLTRINKNFSLKGAVPENNLNISAENPVSYFGTGGQALNVLDYKDGSFCKREAVGSDLVNIIKICEELDNVDYITRPVEPDVARERIDIEKTKIFQANTRKHINLANLVVKEKLPEILKLVKDKELISFISCVPVSPLKLEKNTAEKFIDIVNNDIAVAISSCPQAGMTAPLSEPGELLQVNTELLAAIILANLIKPGARVMYRGIPITSNLHLDNSPRWSQPDSIKRVAAITSMTYFYGVPCCGTCAVADEKEPNAQNISEKILSWTMELASGAQYINSALGMMEQVMTVSPEQYIIDDMLITMLKEAFTAAAGLENRDLRQIVTATAAKGFSALGAVCNDEITAEINKRLDFIFTEREAYNRESLEKQLLLIQKAVLSGKSSAVFMRKSRAGLRKGFLYAGNRISGKLDLQNIIKKKDNILNKG
ncbi:MAG TPA: trimethylamine methyltransferase family protein [Spirochaetota bacterium]|nr:trimethylamine methyltransferase family protein [Spirochaetota bacterium]